MNRSPGLFAAALLAVAACDEPAGAPLTDATDVQLDLVVDTQYIAGASLDGDDYIGRVGSLGFDSRGRLHVIDLDRYRVASWDDRGRRVRTIGNRGEGPQELRAPRFGYILRDGTVIVGDIGHQVLQVFGPNGRHVRRVHLRQDGGGPIPGGEAVLARGRLVGTDDPWFKRTNPSMASRPLYAYSFTGDTVKSVPFHDAWRAPLDQRNKAMLPTVRIAGFPDGRVAVADSVGYRVRILSEDGAVDQRINRPILPFPLTDIAMAAYRERQRDAITERGLVRALGDLQSAFGVSLRNVNTSEVVTEYRESLDEVVFADEIPVIRALQVDWEGRLWITRSDMAGDDGSIDIINAAGRYAGTIPSGELGSPDAFGPDGLLAYVEETELGAQAVLVVRITSLTRMDSRQ